MKNVAILTLAMLMLAGCTGTQGNEPLVDNMPPASEDVDGELPDLSDDIVEVLKSPALEDAFFTANAVIEAGPESEVSEEEFQTLVDNMVQELNNLLGSHSYEGNETVDGFVTDLLNVDPSRHEGMGPKSYEEYYGMVSETAKGVVNWATN